MPSAKDCLAACASALSRFCSAGVGDRPKLWLFLTRDQGGLLDAESRAGKAIQYEIGNPLTPNG